MNRDNIHLCEFMPKQNKKESELENIKEENMVEYGKNFSCEHKYHNFDGKSQKLINFLVFYLPSSLVSFSLILHLLLMN